MTEGGARKLLHGVEVDTRIGKANAAPRELSRSVVTKRELSNTAKL